MGFPRDAPPRMFAMNRYSLFHLEDGALRRRLLAAVPAFHASTTALIAHLAEFDARRLYAPEGYPSMCAFCVRELGLTDQVARKLIRVGRTARKFSEIFEALADGRLNPTGVILLTPWLVPENVTELLAAAARKTNDEIRELLADRAPRLDEPFLLEALPGGIDSEKGPAAEPIGDAAETSMVSVQTPGVTTSDSAGSFGHTAETSMVSAQTPVTQSRPRLEPLGGGRFETRFTMGHKTYDVLRRFEEMTGRQVTSEEMDEAARLGLEAMIAACEKRRFGATDRPHQMRKPARGRHIPAAVKRAVAERDGGRCTFVAANGRRCDARGRLEFDHVVPVARGGASTLDNLRLRCRTHNQYEAGQVFGAGFMDRKREQARNGRAGQSVARDGASSRNGEGALERQGASAMPAATVGQDSAQAGRGSLPAADSAPRLATDPYLDVTPWLMRLGVRKRDALSAAAHCETMADAALEERVKAALSFLAPPARVSGGACNGVRQS